MTHAKDPRQNLRLGPQAQARPGVRRYNVKLPEELVAAVDAVAGARGRSAWIEDALRERLQRPDEPRGD